MKRWTTLGGLAALLVALLLAVFAFAGPEPLSTQDIDAFDHDMNEKLHPATFVPGVPREEVVRKALESAGRVLIGKDTSTLETRATVGTSVHLEGRRGELGGGEKGVAGGRGRPAGNLPLRPGRD